MVAIRASGCPGRCSPMATATRGIVSATLTQKRRRMSTSSAFSSSPTVAVLGSGRIPDDFRVHGADPFLPGGDRNGGNRFERHAALGTVPWPRLPYLRMHRADE